MTRMIRKFRNRFRTCMYGVKGCPFVMPGHPHKIGNRWVH